MPADPSHATPGRRRSRLGWILLVVLGAAGLGFTYWYNHRPDASGGPRQGGFRRFAFGAGMGMSMPVVAAKAQKEPIDIYLNGLGTVTPLATVTLRTQISGQIREIHFKEGQEVKKGDLLVVIDPRPYQAVVDQAQSQLARDQAQLANAKLDLARYQNAYKQHAVTQQQVATAQATVDADSATIGIDRANLETAELNLAFTHIVSPIDGRVGLRQVDPGNLVQAGAATGLVTITQLQPITVIFTLAEDDLSRVAPAMVRNPKLRVDALDRDLSRTLAQGTLLTIDNQINTASGTVRARAEFPNTGNELFPNQFVNARLYLQTLNGANLVPTAALQHNGESVSVYVIGQGGAVESREVKVTATEGENAAVTGVNPGDEVVTDGFDKLQNGSRVAVRGQGKAGAASGPKKPPKQAAAAAQ
jgi:multidrug efflux system membrane fusion protein